MFGVDYSNNLMTPRDVAKYLRISRTTLYRILKEDPSFPNRTRVSRRLVLFRKSEIDDWIKTREVY
jgi:excisionase family DNA binding protein